MENNLYETEETGNYLKMPISRLITSLKSSSFIRGSVVLKTFTANTLRSPFSVPFISLSPAENSPSVCGTNAEVGF